MKTPFNIQSPVSPYDVVYTVDKHGKVRSLVVSQLQIVDGNDLAICFNGYPYMLVDEAREKLFDTYQEAADSIQKS